MNGILARICHAVTRSTWGRLSVVAVLLGSGLGLTFGQPAGSTSIPARPEQLTFPPLTYEPPNPADYRVVLKAGPVSYVVPDRELPLVSISVFVRAGEFVQPEGKEGLSELTGFLLARGGAAQKSAEELEERLDFLAARLSSGIGETHGVVSLNLLSKDLEEGLGLLRDVLVEPRFQENKLDLHKEEMLQAMRRRNDDSSDIEARERQFLAYGERFWANRYPTAASLTNISRADLIEFHRAWVHPQNFVVSANGDFDRADMIARLERLFAEWPFTGQAAPAIPTNTQFAASGIYIVDKDVNQGRVSILLPGITRDNPDLYAVLVMNDVLGGGGFTSRLVNRVRSDEGLAYSAGSSFPGGIYFPAPFTAGFQSKSRTVPYAVSIILEEMKKITAEAVSAEELETAKKSFIESFPQTFATKGQIANAFAQDELTGRYRKDPDYWKNYRRNIDLVDAAQVQRVAGMYLHPEDAVILIVGQKEEILKGHPNYPVTLSKLTKHPVVDVPLRDPLTMR